MRRHVFAVVALALGVAVLTVAPTFSARFRPSSDRRINVVGDIEVARGDTVDVALGAAHRIRNTGPGPLVFVEVQHGDYFGEDDIVRLDDDFGRVS
jgi:oxalate decarboxylase/phosphoglucose isomerase-like protein (cupin superfamily)